MSGIVRVAVGDLIAIPLRKDQAIAKVVYVSRYFRNVVALRVLGRRVSDLTSSDLTTGPWLPRLVFTGSQTIGKEWKRIGTTAVTPDEQALTRRLVAGHVWLLDEDLGPASSGDRNALRSMGVAGMHAVHEQLEKLLPARA